MGWFKKRRPPSDPPGTVELESGSHRSPGLAALVEELERRRPQAILDLGASSTENVAFLSRFCANLTIQDLYRVASAGAPAGVEPFRFPSAEELDLPEPGELFDAILMWDLIHYFEPDVWRRFLARLAELCRPDALVFLMASSSAPVPPVPIQFRIEDAGTLYYVVPEATPTADVSLRTRQVESLMAGFEPVRFFQLRNGIQDFLFRHRVRSKAPPP